MAHGVRWLKIGDRVYDHTNDLFGRVEEFAGFGKEGAAKVLVLVDGEQELGTYYEFELVEAEIDCSTIWGL